MSTLKKYEPDAEDEIIDEDAEEEILGGGSTLTLGASTADPAERQAAKQRDIEPDDYDGSTDATDDRVRGAGQQSLDELTLTRGLGKGLAEHVGGLRHDRPEPNVNDPDPDAYVEEAV
jgi:hypothetical protein